MDAFAQGAVSLVKDDTGMWVDYLTDSVILAEAVYNGEESLWEQAAAVYSSGPEEGEKHRGRFAKSRLRWKELPAGEATPDIGTETLCI